ncbi:hypothetical protein F7R91_09965 [Streptomyces luteolifulvus]|uniref:Uncharacterized protein n=1 Tax=Streptomyces luteolifulvus TaxID=2615112 RepID=A0A6H9V1P1_9ACTN|nr:hypothetical protein [Streptomyces luteolifulvus]KAB1148218.1 hypothetical protein F7R91_09965 [Streptomyces luteolifulvus]
MSAVRPVGESARRVLRHEVRAVHGTSGAPVPVAAAFVDRPPRGWELRIASGGAVVLTGPDPGNPVAPVRLRLTVVDAAAAMHLAAPEAVIALDQGVVTHRFVPLPTTLELLLVTAQGPSSGRTVAAHPTRDGGPGVPLPEQPDEPGCYRSAPTVWTEDFHRFEIRVDGNLLRRAFIDTGRRTTRIRLIDTTG